MKQSLTMTNSKITMKLIPFTFLLMVSLFSGCGGGSSKPSTPATTYPPVPATACGVATPAATASSSDERFVDPLNISDAGGLSEHPSIVSHTGGKVYVVWDDDTMLPGENIQKKDIYFRVSNNYGSTYSAKVNISQTGNATIANMGVAADGKIHVAWQDVLKGPSEIFYVRSTDGGATFPLAGALYTPPGCQAPDDCTPKATPLQVSAVNPGADINTQSTDVSIAVDPRPFGTANGGFVYIAWSESNLGTATFTLKIARSTDQGASFSIYKTYTPVSVGGSTATTSLHVDGAGTLHIVWAESSIPGGVTTRKIHYATDATLPANIVLATGSTLSSPIVTVDPTNLNRIYVAWRNEDTTNIHFAKSINGGTSFGADAGIVVSTTNPKGRAISSRLATGPDGTLYMSWTDNRGGNYDTYFSKSTDQGATFVAPVNFAPSAQGSLFTAIAVDDESNIYIAWDDNRYTNPPGTSEELADEGNFEILVSRGKFGLPAVQSALATPCPITPNGDSSADTSTISAIFSTVLNWVLQVIAPDGTVVFTQAGSGSTMSVQWDGRNGGTVVADALYTYRITGTDVGGLVATAASGFLNLFTTAEDAVPVIKSFSREAFGFSPNGDGFKDSNGISAEFNKPVNWVIQLKDSSGVAKRTLTGSGVTIDSTVTRWDGKDDAGTLLPEANYTMTITATDGLGQSASCGPAPIVCLNMQIDSTVPSVTNPAVDQTTYTPGGGNLLHITGTPVELALVTIYVYNEAGVLVRKVNRTFRDGGVTFDQTWDGQNGIGVNATPGNYQVYMWCRDRAGNTAATYPYKINFTIP